MCFRGTKECPMRHIKTDHDRSEIQNTPQLRCHLWQTSAWDFDGPSLAFQSPLNIQFSELSPVWTLSLCFIIWDEYACSLRTVFPCSFKEPDSGISSTQACFIMQIPRLSSSCTCIYRLGCLILVQISQRTNDQKKSLFTLICLEWKHFIMEGYWNIFSVEGNR